MSNRTKISVSLSPTLVADLDYLADRMRVSRSALISEFLSEAAAETRKVMALIPPNPTPAEVVRFRGQSEDVVRSRIDSLKGMADDLFSE